MKATNNYPEWDTIAENLKAGLGYSEATLTGLYELSHKPVYANPAFMRTLHTAMRQINLFPS